MTDTQRFVVATHGHCFDGLASAVVFTRALLKLRGSAANFEYRTCGYGAGQPKADDALLNGHENAILDYRFHPSSRLSWYFDHHRTAFHSADDRAFFEQERARGRNYYFDSGYSSCTKFIADVMLDEFGIQEPELDELIHWADIVDSAKFDSPEAAVSRADPVMQLVSVVEHYGDDGFFASFVPELARRPLTEVARSNVVRDRYRPLGKKHERFVQRVRERGERRGRVVFVDLTDRVVESVGKFVTYALYPDSVYSVLVGSLKNGPKISVGYNPWSGRPRDADISAICARYGGGGHPVVGGIAFGQDEVERARAIARLIADELAG